MRQLIKEQFQKEILTLMWTETEKVTRKVASNFSVASPQET